MVRYLVKDLRPFSTVSSEPFRKMIKALNPRYQCPDQRTVATTLVPAWYDIEKRALVDQLKSLEWVALTGDHWTSLSQDHFLTITVHFIQDWQLYNKVLVTRPVYVSQTGENISSEIEDVLAEFGIESKVSGMTVDNAQNMHVGVTRLNITKLGCFAHTMNLAAQKVYGIPAIARWIGKVRAIVVWFRRVHMAHVVLEEKQKLLGVPQHKVILDVRTRWNTLYLMIERFSEQYPALTAAMRDSRLKKNTEHDK